MEYILSFLFFYLSCGIIFNISLFLILFTLNQEKSLSFKDYIINFIFYPLVLTHLLNYGNRTNN